MKRLRRWTLLGVAGLAVLCVLAAGAAALSNIGLPDHSPVIERLSPDDKLRLSEIRHLRAALGDRVWPGWSEADIPIILYNEEYAFLVGLADPPAGWTTVPGNQAMGGPWEVVPDDQFEGQPYYRQRLASRDANSQAFTVRVGDSWVASMPTKPWFEIGLRRQFQDDLPGFLRPIFPYRLAVHLFIGRAEVYIGGVQHESFHAFEGIAGATKLEQAERAQRTYQDRYPWDAPQLEQLWQEELDLLASAVRGGTDDQAIELTRQFLAQREARRQQLGLSPVLVGYEQQREWVEGLAKYAELEIWGAAAADPTYTPVDGADQLPGFDGYAGFDRRYASEVDQTRLSGGSPGDGRFYYSGLTQALLLDRLMPGWQARVMEPAVFLDELLQEATR
jgi:hypothetical protein